MVKLITVNKNRQQENYNNTYTRWKEKSFCTGIYWSGYAATETTVCLKFSYFWIFHKFGKYLLNNMAADDT